MKRYGSLGDFDKFDKQHSRLMCLGGIAGALMVVANITALGFAGWVVYKLLQFYSIV